VPAWPSRVTKSTSGFIKQVEREVLLAVARGDAPHIVLVVAEVAQGLQHGGLAVDLPDLAVEGRFAVVRFEEHELVHHQRRDEGAGDAVIGRRVAALDLLPGLHVLAVLGPEVVRQLDDARVQQVGIFQHVVVEVVFGGQAQGARLDAHVDVLRHQHDRAARLVRFQRAHHAQDLVVGLARGEAFGQGGGVQAGLEVQAALGILVAQLGQRDAGFDRVVVGVRDQGVQRARYLARVAGDFRHALLVVVELLERHHRQVDVVFLEAEQRGRVVHQHVRVEHEHLGPPALSALRLAEDLTLTSTGLCLTGCGSFMSVSRSFAVTFARRRSCRPCRTGGGGQGGRRGRRRGSRAGASASSAAFDLRARVVLAGHGLAADQVFDGVVLRLRGCADRRFAGFGFGVIFCQQDGSRLAWNFR
jgi:hypothetical protein